MSAKVKKKRNKRYNGADARVTRPVVMKVEAEELSALQEWWRTYGQLVRFAAVAVGIVLLIALLVIGIVGIFTA
jgi:hypothetical protein